MAFPAEAALSCGVENYSLQNSLTGTSNLYFDAKSIEISSVWRTPDVFRNAL
jgi:hypothetical protein